jgi:DNA replication protein DnaC
MGEILEQLDSWIANVLFHVVNDRYLHYRPMIFTTNKPLAPGAGSFTTRSSPRPS